MTGSRSEYRLPFLILGNGIFAKNPSKKADRFRPTYYFMVKKIEKKGEKREKGHRLLSKQDVYGEKIDSFSVKHMSAQAAFLRFHASPKWEKVD